MECHRLGVRAAVVAGMVGGLAGAAAGQFERVTIDPVPAQVLSAQNFVVDSVHFGALDVQGLVAEDRAREISGMVPRFAQPQEVDYSPSQFGSVQLLEHGRIAWRLDIQADGAHSINIGTQFNVPNSLSMYLLNAEGQTLWGEFTSRDNFQGQMWSPIIPGDTMRIYAEMDEADWNQFEAGFRITSVNIGYRGIGEALASRAGHEDATRSDACHTDVACEEADPWCQQVKGAACYTIGGFGTCSCSMLNNTAEDERPILYTAFHCETQNNPGSVRVYFNFQNATCRTPGGASSGGAGTCGNINFGGIPCNTNTISGATVITTQQPADSVLLELSSTPPDSYQVVYLGWSAAETIPSPPVGQTTWAFGIHHPGVEEKRIAFENDTMFKQAISIGFVVNAWAVDYDNGGIEGGSSGSPLFDAYGRVIGACTAVDQFDSICNQNQWYGRLEEAWDTNATFRTTLDPVNGGAIESMNLHQFFADTAPEAFGFELKTPSNGAINQTSGPWLDWNGACYTDEYRVVLSDQSNLSSPLIDEMVAVPATLYTVPFGTLAPSTTYYWQIQAMNTVGTTNSPIWSFSTMAPPAPGSFSLLSPANGAADVETGPVLDWQDSTNADDYLVEVDDSVTFTSPVVSQVVGVSTLDLPNLTLAFDTQYFWRVTAMNETGNTVSTPSLSGFHTAAVPPCPCSADLDGDCDADVFDFGIFASNFGGTVTPGTDGDLDGDGDVDVFDFSLFAGGFGCTS